MSVGVELFQAFHRFEYIDVIDFRKDVIQQEVDTFSLEHDLGFIVDQADDPRVRPGDFPDGEAEEGVGEQVASHHEKVLFSLGAFTDGIHGPGFVEGKEQKVQRNVVRPSYDGEFIEKNGITLRIHLIVSHVDLGDPADIERDRRQ